MNKAILWTKEEINILEELAGYHPFERLVKLYQSVAAKRGLRYRTRYAIKRKMELLGISRTPIFDMINATELSRILGRNYHTILNWIYGKKFKAQKTGRVYSISIKEITDFARREPEFFYGIDYAQLSCVLTDLDLARELASKKTLFKAKKPVSIYNLKTGKIFKSIGEAAKYHNCSHQSILRSLNSNKPTKQGERFKRL